MHIKQPLSDLLTNIEQEMKRLHYTEGTLKFYRRRWKMLTDFAKMRGETEFSEQLGWSFIEHHFGLLEKDCARRLKTSEVQELRVIRMIGDFQLHHAILRRCYKFKQILTNPYWLGISGRFRQYCTAKGYSNVTTDHYVKKSAEFMDYLTAQEIMSGNRIDLGHINSYIKTLAGYSYKMTQVHGCKS